MLKVDGFVQRDPKDGSPISRKLNLSRLHQSKISMLFAFVLIPNGQDSRHMVRREQ